VDDLAVVVEEVRRRPRFFVDRIDEEVPLTPRPEAEGRPIGRDSDIEIRDFNSTAGGL
jgi:hypothetical protein